MWKGKDYYEERARQTLHIACGYDIQSLVRADKPDLQDQTNGIGIEVVRDVYEPEEAFTGFVYDLEKHPEKITEQRLEARRKKGGIIDIENGTITHASLGKTYPNDPNHLIEVIKGKIDKIEQKGYQQFAEYRLYVFVDTMLLHEYCESFIYEVMAQVAKYKTSPYTVIYLDQQHIFYECNIVSQAMKRIDISKEDRDKIDSITKENINT